MKTNKDYSEVVETLNRFLLHRQDTVNLIIIKKDEASVFTYYAHSIGVEYTLDSIDGFAYLDIYDIVKKGIEAETNGFLQVEMNKIFSNDDFKHYELKIVRRFKRK